VKDKQRKDSSTLNLKTASNFVTQVVHAMFTGNGGGVSENPRYQIKVEEAVRNLTILRECCEKKLERKKRK
jgi:hypothetical protein